jgi:hypothetical protein
LCAPLQEEKVLTEPSLEWGCWLLQFLLSTEVVRACAGPDVQSSTTVNSPRVATG